MHCLLTHPVIFIVLSFIAFHVCFWLYSGEKERERSLWKRLLITNNGATPACSVFGSRSVLCNNKMWTSGVVCATNRWHGTIMFKQWIHSVTNTKVPSANDRILLMCRAIIHVLTTVTMTNLSLVDKMTGTWQAILMNVICCGEIPCFTSIWFSKMPTCYFCLDLDCVPGVATNRLVASSGSHVTTNMMLRMLYNEIERQRPCFKDHVCSPFFTWKWKREQWMD